MKDYQQGISDADWIGADDAEPDRSVELLPCPFCGGEGKAVGNVLHGPFFVICFGLCGCAIGVQYDHRGLPDHKFKTRNEAAEAWNRRLEK